jgi:hypothetical protein
MKREDKETFSKMPDQTGKRSVSKCRIIRTRIDFGWMDPDPVPHWEHESGSRRGKRGKEETKKLRNFMF